MTKNEMIQSIADNANITKAQATKAFDAVQNNVTEAVKKEGRFSWPGFGTFTQKHKKASSGVAMGKPWKKAAHNTVGFKPAQALKDVMGKRPFKK